jgi:hypothetical protein
MDNVEKEVLRMLVYAAEDLYAQLRRQGLNLDSRTSQSLAELEYRALEGRRMLG